MNTFKFKFVSFAIACVILIVATSSQCKTSPKLNMPSSTSLATTTTNGFAVMELFTSQGCSSCPPADNLLGKYAAQNSEGVIALAFHVDYWNRLGWTDSFSTSKFTNRQQQYSAMIDNSSVYTPQLVINGTREFVGSDDSRAAAEVENALKQKPAVQVSIDNTQRSGQQVEVNYSLDKTIDNTIVQAALVQKQVITHILRGENRGLKLTNYNVVRDFISVPARDKSAAVDLTIPTGYNEKDFSVVIYVQDNASGKIIGAMKKSL